MQDIDVGLTILREQEADRMRERQQLLAVGHMLFVVPLTSEAHIMEQKKNKT